MQQHNLKSEKKSMRESVIRNSMYNNKSGNIYISSNYGKTWIPRAQTEEWYGISLSSSGQYQTAVVDGGYLYIRSLTSVDDSTESSLINDDDEDEDYEDYDEENDDEYEEDEELVDVSPLAHQNDIELRKLLVAVKSKLEEVHVVAVCGILYYLKCLMPCYF